MAKRGTRYAVRGTNHIYAVVLVGGKGKRLWPISTSARPKAFLPVFKGAKTMFKKTLERIGGLVPLKKIVVVANRKHSHHVKKDFPDIPRGNLLLEPASRNTAPAIALAASVLKRRHEDAIMMVLPTDHYIIGEKRYRAALKAGVDLLERRPDIFVTIGVKPTFPSTGFGYIKVKGHKSQVMSKAAHEVEKFTEKPSLGRARAFVRDGRYLWNSGVFMFWAGRLLEAVGKFAPEILKGLKGPAGLSSRYKRLPNISIDYAVMEKADNICCIVGEFGWRDMGSHEALGEILKMESAS